MHWSASRSLVRATLSAAWVVAFVGCGAPVESQETFAPEALSLSEVDTTAQELAGYSLWTNASSYWPGSTITIHWQAPDKHNPYDWVGLYTAGASNTSYIQWEYVPFGTSGSLTFTAPNADGTYEFRYLLNNGYTSAAVSNRFVVSTPSICRALRDGDPYHPTWISCCDSVDKVYSYWTRWDGFANWYSGSCWSWGVRP
jgi:hypothetical protein